MPRYIGLVLYKYKARVNSQISTRYTRINIDITTEYNKLQSEINNLVRERQQALEEDYNIDFIEGHAVSQDIYNSRTDKPRTIRLIRMKDAQAPLIDTFPAQPWNTNQGTCVIDYLYDKYQLKRKIPTKEHLIKILQEDDDEDIVQSGVSTKNIENFANYINIPIYVLNDFDEIEYEYKPPNYKPQKHYPVLVYRVSNNHFYPIEDPAKKLHYIKRTLERKHSPFLLVKQEEEEIDLSKIQYIDNPIEHLLNLYKTQNILPNTINMVDNEITAFTINDKRYKHQPYHSQIKQACEKLSLKYQSQSVITFIMKYLQKTFSDISPISHHNSEILNDLIKAKENRIHKGYIDEYYHLTPPTSLIAWDINKCYRSVLYNPLERWIKLDWTDDWKPYKSKSILPVGLYYVETNDTTLFKKSNIYSSALINYAKTTNIQFKIKKQLIPKTTFSKSLFKEYIDTIINTFGETQFSKELINYLTGIMGKHKDNSYHIKINTDIEQVLSYVLNKPNVIVEDISDDTTKPLYIYGTKNTTIKNETYLPIYIQIIDQSNIKLHQMLQEIKSLGHTPIYRKTDCIVFHPKNKQIYPTYDHTKSPWGQYRKTDVPILNNSISKEPLKIKDKPWIIHPITNSNQKNELLNIIKEQSILISGQAGTGKSHLVQSLSLPKSLMVSFTNRCALNWDDGSTLHSALRITSDGKIAMRPENFRKFCTKYDYIIIDEISMIPKHIWKIISYIKDNSKIKFILIGDENQTKPIEFYSYTKTHYMNNSGVKYIADYNKIILTEIQRYDISLASILKDITKIDLTQFPEKQNTNINLSFSNKTRKMINERYNKKEGLFIPKCDHRYSQDMYIYEDCPVIAYKTDKNKLYVNSEIFTVSHYDEEYIYLYSMRKNEIHPIDIPIEEFANNFVLGYCMTVHKSQGSTITEAFNIYDWNKMDKELRYTALSRAKSISQVGIIQ